MIKKIFAGTKFYTQIDEYGFIMNAIKFNTYGQLKCKLNR